MAPLSDGRLDEARARCEKLRLAAAAAAEKERTAKDAISTAERDVEGKESQRAAAEEAVDKFASTKSSAIAERSRMRDKVAEAEEEIAGLKERLRKCGGAVDVSIGDANSGDSDQGTATKGGDGSSGTASANGSSTTASAATTSSSTPDVTDAKTASAFSTESVLRKLSDRDLNEVRKLHKPPQAVRRALELVQTMLLIAEGKPWPAASDLTWDALLKMLAKDDFIRRVLALKPVALSLQPPALLEQIGATWPSLKDAVGKAPSAATPAKEGSAKEGSAKEGKGGAGRAPRPPSNKRLGGGVGGGGGSGKWSRAAALAASNSSSSNKTPTAASSSSSLGAGGSGAKLKEAAAAALVESKAEGGGGGGGGEGGVSLPLTMHAVEFASKPCGAIFRYCADCASAAMAMAGERETLLVLIEGALKRLAGHRGELSATAAFSEQLVREATLLEDAASAAAAASRAAGDEVLERKLAHARALAALQAAQKALAEAEAKQREEEELAERRREQSERYAKQKAEREREAALKKAAEDEARRRGGPPAGALVWVRDHSSTLPEEVFGSLAIEFGVVGSAALPPNAAALLARVARELQAGGAAEEEEGDEGGEAPLGCVKLHVAGHVQADEAPRLSSQRAQAVGGALIALGISPLRLRAKGYGASVPLSRAAKGELKVKSQRRVTLHAISEVCFNSKRGIEFGEGSAEFEDEEGTMAILREVAALLAQRRAMSLSVEAHTDSEEGRQLLLQQKPGDGGGAAGAAASMSSSSSAAAVAAMIRLSVERAAAVVSCLEGLGVESAAKRLVPHGFGAAFPRSDNMTAEGRRRNRRVELLVIPDVGGGASEAEAAAPEPKATGSS